MSIADRSRSRWRRSLRRDQERDAHGGLSPRVPQRAAGEVEEDRLEVRRHQLDAAHVAPGADDRVEQPGQQLAGVGDEDLQLAVLRRGAGHPVDPCHGGAAAAATSPVSVSRTRSCSPDRAPPAPARPLGADLARRR